MKIGIVSDCHVWNHRICGGPTQAGINRRCELILASIKAASLRAVQLDCTELLVAGDLFDGMRPEPQLITATRDALMAGHEARQSTHAGTLPVVLLVGNHDQASTTLGDHALGPMESEHCGVAEASVWLHARHSADPRGPEVLLVPFRPGDAREWLPVALAQQARGYYDGEAAWRLLVLHMGVIDERTPPWLRNCPDAIEVGTLRSLMREFGFGACALGNWHGRERWRDSAFGPDILQVGALVPTGWDNPGLQGYGTLAIWEPGKGFTIEEITGPRFVEVAAGGVPPLVPEKGTGKAALYARVRAQAQQVRQATLDLETWRDVGLIEDGEVVLDKRELEQADRQAARSAASADTTQRAVAEYVAAMPLEDDGLRADVLAAARRFLE